MLESQQANFKYAPLASQQTSKPTTFQFDNFSRKASRNCSVASLASLGQIELENFRSNDSPCRNQRVDHTSPQRPHFRLDKGHTKPALQTSLHHTNPMQTTAANPRPPLFHQQQSSNSISLEDEAFLAFDLDGNFLSLNGEYYNDLLVQLNIGVVEQAKQRKSTENKDAFASSSEFSPEAQKGLISTPRHRLDSDIARPVANIFSNTISNNQSRNAKPYSSDASSGAVSGTVAQEAALKAALQR